MKNLFTSHPCHVEVAIDKNLTLRGSYTMPNYVKNKIIFNAEGKELEELFDFIKGKETAFDFNTLIPMPDELNIESGSVTDESMIVCNYLDTKVKTKEFISLYEGRRNKKETIEQCLSRLQKQGIINLELGRRALSNLEKYGAPDFYHWRIQNWSTNWNAQNTNVKDNVIEFETAWTAPLRVIKFLSDKFPDVGFEYKWADEDIGANSGEGYFKNGDSIDLAFYGNCEHDALRIYEDCWGKSECIGRDEQGNCFRKSCDSCRLCD